MITALDSFEDGDITEYGGDTGGFVVQNSIAFDGTQALNYNGGASISTLDFSVATGETPLGAFLRSDSLTSGVTSRPRFLFATQSETAKPECYILQIDVAGGTQAFELRKRQGGSTSVLGAKAPNLSTSTWYKLVVTQWAANGDITVEIRQSDDTTITSISATDTAFSSGGIGWEGATDDDHYYDFAFNTSLIAPTNLQITDAETEDELTLDWDTVSNATGYFVYRAEQSGTTKADYTQVADVTGPPYTDTNLEDGERYYYRVSAHN